MVTLHWRIDPASVTKRLLSLSPKRRSWEPSVTNTHVSITQVNKQNITSMLESAQASPMAQTVKSRPAMQETQVQSLGLEDPLEKGMATHSSILAQKIPQTEEPGGLHTVHWVAKSQTRLIDFHFLSYAPTHHILSLTS